MFGRQLSHKRRLATIASSIGLALLLVGLAGASSELVRLSTDPYTNASSQHRTEVEPDTFAFGSTIVAAFQVGRFFDGGASNVGWATSTDGGATWSRGFLPATTSFATPAGPYARISDPAVAYDLKHDAWLISSLALMEGKSGVRGVGVLTSRSTNGGLTWQNPVAVTRAGNPDKNWTVCDNSPSSPFYGRCYTEWDDTGADGRIKMSTSRDGGLTWGPAKDTADSATGIGGQPVVRPDGTVVVPIDGGFGSQIVYFTSTDGGASWGATSPVAAIISHLVAADLRAQPLPSAEIDGSGRVFVAWQDCRFRTNCSSNDIVYATIKPNGSVGAVRRVPIDPTSSTVDHFTPGIAVDPTTSGRTAHLGVAYYYLPVANCGSNCDLHVGFISSGNAGRSWTVPIELAGPLAPSWLANTSQGRMYGDYISTSYVNGIALPGIIVANEPSEGLFDEAAYTTAKGLSDQEQGDLVATEQPVPGAASDHAPATTALSAH